MMADRMGLYECTPCERDWEGKLRPIEIEGREHWTEITAESAGAARYRYLLSLDGCLPDLKIHEIKVRSLNRRDAHWRLSLGWEQRLATANAIIRVMAKYGRHFFSENSDRRELVENPFIAHFKVDKRGELWFIDRYSRKPVLVRMEGRWSGFSDGGTLRGIVQHLAAFIERNEAIEIGYFSPSPKWVCDGDMWGYGADMALVRDEVAALIAEGCHD